MQFHPEVVHTPDGAKLLANFVHNIAGIEGDWTMAAYRDQAVDAIRAQVGDGRVICGLSGGVDSSVAAVLIHEAIGDQLTCIFVDHGLMRKNEAAEVVAMFRDHYNIPLVHVDAADRFIGALEGETDPGDEAQDHRPAVHRRLRGGGEEARRRRIPGPGHALSRRHRERLLHRRPVGDDQVAPQCRRPARAHEHEAGRAAARTVQGRGAGARHASSACPSSFIGRHPFPGPGPRHPLPRRHHARKARHPARGRRRSISTRSARPASTTRSGRPSPCCCRCRPSA